MLATTWFRNLVLINTLAVATITTTTATQIPKNLSSSNKSCAVLYEQGIQAYLDDNFQECVANFNAALEKYRIYNVKLQSCRIKCNADAAAEKPMFNFNVENLQFFEKAVKNTLCILKCKNRDRELFGMFNINEETEKLFEDRKPYEYLQACYFQLKKFQESASAAFTYLVSHPDDKTMLSNLKYYTTFPEVDAQEIINYEAKDYVYLYVYGANAYDKKDWKSVVENMEESLLSYLNTEEECRAQCEGPFDQGWLPDFIPSVANHFTHCLRCKRKCGSKLNNLNGEKHDDLLPSHYHYLQYAYYRLGNLKAACQSVASYLLFYPEDESMLDNLKFYKQQPKIKDSYFNPRPEAVNYAQREAYEKKLLDFIFNEFHFDSDSEETDEVNKKIEVIRNGKELNGKRRYLADNFLKENDCRKLISLAKLFALPGDGYLGNKSPHTSMEIFEGVTINRATFLVHFGLLKSNVLKILLEVTERAKKHIENHFGIPKLYFTYTHLVCRSSLPGAPENRTDFSHAIHADNCNLLENLDCVKSAPSYTWRDYSAIIYLNDNFLGGEFIFSANFNGTKTESIIHPKCGRMVAFSSGSENIHGVRAVKRGSRCAIGIWFTFDPKYQEMNREVAYQMI